MAIAEAVLKRFEWLNVKKGYCPTKIFSINII
jgi:hypothetical protein